MRELRLRRVAAQLLQHSIAGGPEQAVRHLLAVQAQDPVGARLALRARVEGLTAGAVDRALTADRSLVVAWLNRGTLHLVSRDDYPWLLGLTAPTQATGNMRRLAQEGVSAEDTERGVALIRRSLADDGPMPGRELAARVAAIGIRTAGQAMRHLRFAAVLRGLVVQGPVGPAGHSFALVSDWLGTQSPHFPDGDRDRALAELARRYLTGHAPSTDRDLAYWAGLPLRDARNGLRSIGGELVELEGGLLELSTRTDPPDRLPERLLGAFDPSVMGWPDRRWVVPEEHGSRVFAGGGLFRAVATVDGRAVATWSARRREGRIAVRLDPFEQLSADAEAALAAEARDVARFEGRQLED